MPTKKLLLFSLVLIFALGAGEIIVGQKKPARRPSSRVYTISGRLASPNSQLRAATPEGQRRLDTFQKVWDVINNYYYDPTFNGLNWSTIRGEYEPRVFNAKTDAELYTILREMLGRLGRSHLGIIPPEVYQELEKAKTEAKARRTKRDSLLAAGLTEEADAEEINIDDPLSQYGLGVDLRVIGNQFVVTRINDNSAAAYAGLKAGYVIEKINELSLPELLTRLSLYYAAQPAIMRELPGELVHTFLNGEKDSTVDITYLDDSDKQNRISIRRELVKSETISMGKNFPEQQLEFETRALNDETGYVRFNQFAMPVIDKLCAAVTQFKDKKALVIDLRGNTGGVMASMVGLSGLLANTDLDLGTSIYKTREEKLTAQPKAKNYKGRLVFLVDGSTMSAAEMFASSFQESGRALVVGDQTAGASLPSMVIDLPTRAVMQYPIANYRSSKGVFLEGKGVTPDFKVSLDRKSLASGHDLQLEKAISLIKEDTAFPVISPPPDLRGFVSASAGPPPPPPPMKTVRPLKVLGEVTVKLPPPPKAEIPVSEPAAVNLVNDYLNAIGGAENLANIKSFSMEGTAEITIRGSAQDFTYGVYRQSADKYAEIMSSPATGEVREVYNGKTHFSQADYGLFNELPATGDTSAADILAPIRMLTKPDTYASMKYLGTYDREGRKVQLVDATLKAGFSVALAFDAETKMLTSFTSPYFEMVFSDYRKTGDMTLPFQIERQNMMRIRFDDIKLNMPVDDSKFAKKINCYDVPN